MALYFSITSDIDPACTEMINRIGSALHESDLSDSQKAMIDEFIENHVAVLIDSSMEGTVLKVQPSMVLKQFCKFIDDGDTNQLVNTMVMHVSC